MMIIGPPDDIYMQRNPCCHCPTTQSVMYHLRIQLPHHWPFEVKVANEEGTRRNIDDGAR